MMNLKVLGPVVMQALITAMGPFFSLFSKIFLVKEYNENHQLSDGLAPIFIIGAPRTGSTILYQGLTNQADVLYIDNLACKLNGNLLFGLWLSKKKYKERAHNCFDSDHGATLKFGGHAPSECGGFWYRWFSTQYHFVDHGGVSDSMIKAIRKEVLIASYYFQKPMVFKNLNAGQRLRVLVQAFPNAKIVFVRRNPLYTAQSILIAKRKLGIADNRFWSIMPGSVSSLRKMEWPKQIVMQIYDLERQIATDLSLFEKNNVYTIGYRQLSSKTLGNLISSMGLAQRESFEPAEINQTDKLVLSNEEVSLLKAEIAKLDWSEMGVK